MKYLGIRRWLLISVIGISASALATGLIQLFSWDLFAGCIDGSKAADSFSCEYSPQLMVNLLAGLFFFTLAFALMVKTTRMLSALSAAVMSLVFFLLLMLVWRWEISLSDNFLLYSGPETFRDYLYLGLLSFDTALVTTVIALFYNWGDKLNSSAKSKGRKEPRSSDKKK